MAQRAEPATGVLRGLPYAWNGSHRAHDPAGEVWVGTRIAGTERPERAERIRAALRSAGAREVAAAPQPEQDLLAVHDPGLVGYLSQAWDDWQAAGLDRDPGQDRVVPYLFPHPGMLGEIVAPDPPAAAARAGYFAYDTMSLIGPGSWEGIRGAADTALTAAGLVAGGEPLAYACCRPPGHHATRSAFGGSCYLNNAAIAAARLRGSGSEQRTVAILDVDAHHGNGTQSIFYGDPGVLSGSVHVDPGAGWFPHLLGFAEEIGTAAGRGANLNLPLAPGAGDEPWLAAVAALCDWAHAGEAAALVVALGVDAAGGDPEAPLRVSAAGYREAGRLLGALGLPTVVVQEGGYALETVGELVVAALDGLLSGRGAAPAQRAAR